MKDPKNNHPEEKREQGGAYCYRYPHPAVTADCVIFGFNGKALKILLIERGNPPFLGYWALPGGFMRLDETIEGTAARELREETNLSNVYLDQFKVYSRVNRDPRERVITVAFIALVKPDDYEVIAGDDAAKAFWFDDDMLPPLAFDHAQIIREAREHLKEILVLKPVAFELLNKTFTISQLQTVYEVINKTSYDRRNFLRTAIDSDIIAEVPNPETSGRNGKLYRLNEEAVREEERPEAPRASSMPGPFLEEAEMGFSSLPEEDRNIKYSMPPRHSRILRPALTQKSKPKEEKEEKESRKAPTKGLFGFLGRKK